MLFFRSEDRLRKDEETGVSFITNRLEVVMGCCSHESKHSCCGSHHHHHHHGDSCCSHGGCSCPCHEEECHEEESCSAEKLFEIADCAWVELLKEKIKEHILASDTKINELAKIVAEANHKRWKHKMERDKCDSHSEECALDFEEALCRLYSSCSTGSCKTEHSSDKK